MANSATLTAGPRGALLEVAFDFLLFSAKKGHRGQTRRNWLGKQLGGKAKVLGVGGRQARALHSKGLWTNTSPSIEGYSETPLPSFALG
jgi:hypothetical protein